MVSQILRLFQCIDFHGFGLFLGLFHKIVTSLFILVTVLSMFYCSFYCIFSCYLPSRKPGLRYLHICCYSDNVEVGSNISTVALRVVGGDKKGSLESETVKYGRESHGTRAREWMRWRGPAAIVNDRPILSSERMLYKDCDRRCSIE
jgi:hypothetical protein